MRRPHQRWTIAAARGTIVGSVPRVSGRKEERTVNLSAPKKWTFVAAVILWIVGLVGAFVVGDEYPIIGLGASFWIGMLGGLILILGNMLEGF